MANLRWDDATEITDVFAAIKHIDASDADALITLRTEEDGLLNLGSRYWLAVANKLLKDYPEHKMVLMVDAGDNAGLVQGALADGHQYVRFTGDDEAFTALADIADQHDAKLIR